jgi:hypothetical protein
MRSLATINPTLSHDGMRNAAYALIYKRKMQDYQAHRFAVAPMVDGADR